MTLNGSIQLILFVATILLIAKPIGLYMAWVYDGKTRLQRWLSPLEARLYRWCGIDADHEMTWQQYAGAVLSLSVVGFVLLYLMQRVQNLLPLNPQQLPAITADSSFNTAVSFVTNTNWQGYGGEATMSYLTQMLGLTVQNFVSAATGMAVMAALARSFTKVQSSTIGNFWVDLFRGTTYILVPMSLVLALLLVSQGVVQTFAPAQTATLLEPTTNAEGQAVTEVAIPLGPAASQIAIKQLGTNGGGFFNVNSAHPFENPTPLSNYLQLVSILAIAAGWCYTFGVIVGETRQGWALLAAMTIVFVVLLGVCVFSEQAGTPVLTAAGADLIATNEYPGGNMEGKEARFGIVNSALWATATTAASNGSVNSMHDSFTPLGGLVPMWLMQLGEVIFGGVGSGLYGMLVFVIVAVFISGLMVGRTPEYLGKRIEAFEMKMASLAILLPCATVLLGTAIALMCEQGRATIFNPATHGYSEVLYAFSSAGNNNGSAFAGLGANTPFYNLALGIAMLIGRFWVMLPVLAIAGSIASKKRIAATAGTLPTHTPLFVGLLIGVVMVVGALSFIPALALGPIVEHLLLFSS
ncbi:potassium-transporting ATPase subunit KdpA [Anatilimnocola sp. NA78]|uniref:potassium-transporting ATPase subunit KdpA n=1 Tax=Anatilimnocola sp. NA78 TaxID=3415683 RepID=UPI003CE5912D